MKASSNALWGKILKPFVVDDMSMQMLAKLLL